MEPRRQGSGQLSTSRTPSPWARPSHRDRDSELAWSEQKWSDQRPPPARTTRRGQSATLARHVSSASENPHIGSERYRSRRQSRVRQDGGPKLLRPNLNAGALQEQL